MHNLFHNHPYVWLQCKSLDSSSSTLISWLQTGDFTPTSQHLVLNPGRGHWIMPLQQMKYPIAREFKQTACRLQHMHTWDLCVYTLKRGKFHQNNNHTKAMLSCSNKVVEQIYKLMVCRTSLDVHSWEHHLKTVPKAMLGEDSPSHNAQAQACKESYFGVRLAASSFQ